jgi:hypothetical protein
MVMGFGMKNNYSFRLNVIGNYVDDLVARILFKQNCEFHELNFLIQQIKGNSLYLILFVQNVLLVKNISSYPSTISRNIFEEPLCLCSMFSFQIYSF